MCEVTDAFTQTTLSIPPSVKRVTVANTTSFRHFSSQTSLRFDEATGCTVAYEQSCAGWEEYPAYEELLADAAVIPAHGASLGDPGEAWSRTTAPVALPPTRPQRSCSALDERESDVDSLLGYLDSSCMSDPPSAYCGRTAPVDHRARIPATLRRLRLWCGST